MEVHIYNATDMSQAGNIWVKDIMTTGQGDLRYLARDLEIYTSCKKIQQRASGLGETATGIM